MRSFIKRFMGPEQLGRLEYFRFPDRNDSWGGPFNGQVGRRAIFDAIVRIQRPKLILETGTYRGTTTEILASGGAQVITIEGHPRNYGFSRARLRHLDNVRVLFGDSRLVARRELERLSCAHGSIFAYLDAHWNVDLPLAEELEILFGADPEAIAMIDDFEVLQDPGYGFDDYGPGKVLNSSYISQLLLKFGLVALYPTMPSTQETGAKRGCSILASKQRWEGLLTETGLLRSAG